MRGIIDLIDALLLGLRNIKGIVDLINLTVHNMVRVWIRLIVLLTKGSIGLTDTLVRNLQTAWAFIDFLDKLLIGSETTIGSTDLLDVVFKSLQVREGSEESETKTGIFTYKTFESLRVTLWISLRETLGLTCLPGTLITVLQVNLDFKSLLGTFKTGF